MQKKPVRNPISRRVKIISKHVKNHEKITRPPRKKSLKIKTIKFDYCTKGTGLILLTGPFFMQETE